MSVARKTAHRRLSGLIVAGLAGTLLIATAPAAHAALVVTPGDDRVRVTPTTWWTYGAQGPSTVTSLLNTNNARLTDLSVYSTNPLRFNVTMVPNTGANSIGWAWYYDQTSTQA